MDDELTVLARAHRLFSAEPGAVSLDTAGPHHTGRWQSSIDTDRAATAVLAAARADHARARRQTAEVLDQARADIPAADTPLAQRELLRRRAARLRAQHDHLLTARHRAHQHHGALRQLRYRSVPHRRLPPAGRRQPEPHSRAAHAVRAALTRLGRPYVWGATGPDRFDCSGLTQWAYAQAGVPLERTTYQQIYVGIPVPRSQIRPGDLVFPNTGHVQLAIGDNLVVEAPHTGSAVRISPLGTAVAIRRPTTG